MRQQLTYGFFFVMTISFAFTSCNSKAKPESAYSSAILNGKDRITTDYVVDPEKELPDACDLVDRQTLANLFNVDPIYISPVDGNPDGNRKEHRACFYKWDDPNFPNAAVLIQLQTNTLDEEYDEWMSMSIANKRTTGETMMGESEAHIFKIFPNVGTDGSYNFDIGKYYWRIDNDLMILLAFNMDITEETQYDAAMTIAKEVMGNLSRVEP